jgi:hypothetical protein
MFAATTLIFPPRPIRFEAVDDTSNYAELQIALELPIYEE